MLELIICIGFLMVGLLLFFQSRQIEKLETKLTACATASTPSTEASPEPQGDMVEFRIKMKNDGDLVYFAENLSYLPGVGDLINIKKGYQVDVATSLRTEYYIGIKVTEITHKYALSKALSLNEFVLNDKVAIIVHGQELSTFKVEVEKVY